MIASEQIVGIKRAERREVADLEEWKKLQPKNQLGVYQKEGRDLPAGFTDTYYGGGGGNTGHDY